MDDLQKKNWLNFTAILSKLKKLSGFWNEFDLELHFVALIMGSGSSMRLTRSLVSAKMLGHGYIFRCDQIE